MVWAGVVTERPGRSSNDRGGPGEVQQRPWRTRGGPARTVDDPGRSSNDCGGPGEVQTAAQEEAARFFI